MQVHNFYNSPSDYTRIVIDASTSGAMMKKTIDQTYGMIKDMATNSNQWPRDRLIPRKVVGGTDIEVLSNLVNHVTQLTKQLQSKQGAINSIQANPWEICESCGGQHSTTECQSGQMIVEQAQYVSRFNQL